MKKKHYLHVPDTFTKKIKQRSFALSTKTQTAHTCEILHKHNTYFSPATSSQTKNEMVHVIKNNI